LRGSGLATFLELVLLLMLSLLFLLDVLGTEALGLGLHLRL
jgi:hypothetical protein